jgi:hypothetical protein
MQLVPIGRAYRSKERPGNGRSRDCSSVRIPQSKRTSEKLARPLPETLIWPVADSLMQKFKKDLELFDYFL